jgi:hypothetical protein
MGTYYLLVPSARSMSITLLVAALIFTQLDVRPLR